MENQILQTPQESSGPLQGWRDLEGMYKKSHELWNVLLEGRISISLKDEQNSSDFGKPQEEVSSLLSEIEVFQTRITRIMNILPRTSHQGMEGTEIDWEQIEQRNLHLPPKIIQREEGKLHMLYRQAELFVTRNNLGSAIRIPTYNRETLSSFVNHWGTLKHILKKPTQLKSGRSIPVSSLQREVAGTVTRLFNTPGVLPVLRDFTSGDPIKRKILGEILRDANPTNPKDIELVQIKTLLEAASFLNVEQTFAGITERGTLEDGVGIRIKSTNYPTLTFTSLEKIEGSLYTGEAEYVDIKTKSLKKRRFRIQLSSLYTLEAINIWDGYSGKAIPNFVVNSFQRVSVPKRTPQPQVEETPGNWWKRIKNTLLKK